VISYTKLFYKLVGPKLLVLLAVMQAAAILEGFGISLMLPIIQGDQSTESRLASIINWGFDLISVAPTLINILVALILFFTIRAVLLIGQSWYQSRILARNLTNMRTEFINSLIKVEHDYLNTQDPGVLSNVMSSEILRVNFALAQLLGLMVSVTTSIVYVGIALLVAPVVTIFLAVLILPIAVIMLFINRITTRASLELTDGSNRQQSFLLEVFRNMKYLKATGRTTPVAGRVEKEITRVGEAFRKLTFMQGATTAGLEPLIVLVLAVVIYFFTEIRGSNILEILFLLFIFRTAAVNLVATQPAYRKFIAATGSMQVYTDLRKKIETHQEADTSTRQAPDIGDGFELKNISYQYPNHDSPIIDGVSALINARSTVAFVGPSGSGKTTTANIIATLLTPTKGDVLLGNTPYNKINLEQFRQNIGYVTQESVVFNASIQDNISLWADSVDSQKLDDVITKTGLRSVLENEGNRQRVGDAGASLSGGERQRLSIARELYWDSELLILDEATSSVDSLLERQIDEIITKQRGSKTIIVIAHRLSTVKTVDNIFVFDHGKIAESGTFDELLNRGGLFAKMAKLQSF
jgi:ABC-type bacteriocin/lantibiotic exporter with double-glycine peptidase domain